MQISQQGVIIIISYILKLWLPYKYSNPDELR